MPVGCKCSKFIRCCYASVLWWCNNDKVYEVAPLLSRGMSSSCTHNLRLTTLSLKKDTDPMKLLKNKTIDHVPLMARPNSSDQGNLVSVRPSWRPCLLWQCLLMIGGGPSLLVGPPRWWTTLTGASLPAQWHTWKSKLYRKGVATKPRWQNSSLINSICQWKVKEDIYNLPRVRTFVNVPVHVIMNHRYSSTPHSQNFKSSTYVHYISREMIVLFKKDTKKLIILSLN